MTMSAPQPGSYLVMPLLRLAPAAVPDLVPTPRPVPRTLDLDVRRDTTLLRWAPVVREAVESVLLVDADGRVMAMSDRAAAHLGVDALSVIGALLLDLVTMVDFSATGVPLIDPELQAPPLRALRAGGMARGLMRLRRGECLVTYDVVGVRLDGGAGALAFLTEV